MVYNLGVSHLCLAVALHKQATKLKVGAVKLFRVASNIIFSRIEHGDEWATETIVFNTITVVSAFYQLSLALGCSHDAKSCYAQLTFLRAAVAEENGSIFRLSPVAVAARSIERQF